MESKVITPPTDTFTINASSIWPCILQQVDKDVSLFPHQVDAVKWLVEREFSCNDGNLLGDVMGLGKTITTVTLISLNLLPRTLIVCSKSLICQWARELAKQNHRIYRLEPSCARKIIISKDKISFSKKDVYYKDMPESFVGITSYGKVKPFPEPKHSKETEMTVLECASEPYTRKLTAFRRITWDRIVVDEVHNLRNGLSLNGDKSAQLRKKSLRFYRMLRLRKREDTKILGLTGTPIQNRIGDIASVFLFLRYNVDRMTNKEDLKKLIKVNMFRRNTSNLSDLTKVIILYPTEPYRENKVIVKYETEEEMDFYKAAAGDIAQKLKLVLGGYDKIESEDSILTLLTLLRLLSSHPAGYIKCYNKRYKKPLPEWTGSVSKFTMIEQQLANYHNSGESCIVFVHFYEEAARIAALDIGYKNVEFMNGTVSVEDRDYIVHKSKKVMEAKGTFLIIANIIACGEGLNLQHFHNVIVASVDYNPQNEAQAIARVYRIGSVGPVNVTRYYHEAIEDMKGTLNIDKFMKNKQDEKIKIAEELIDNLPNAAWTYPVTLIPDTDIPSTIFPKPLIEQPRAPQMSRTYRNVENNIPTKVIPTVAPRNITPPLPTKVIPAVVTPTVVTPTVVTPTVVIPTVVPRKITPPLPTDREARAAMIAAATAKRLGN